MARRSFRWAIFGFCLAAVLGGELQAEAPFVFDPYWLLVHERAVPDDLKLTPTQQTAWKAALDPLDLRFFTLRNKSATVATEGQTQIVAAARPAIVKVLQPSQQARLDALLARRLGTQVLLRDDFAQKIGLTDAQRPEVKAAVDEAQAALAKAREAKDKSSEATQKEIADIETAHSKKLQTILRSDQQQKWRDLVAIDFDLSRFGHTAFQPPELNGDAAAWKNSPPLSLGKLRGQVVIVHFFAFGCINCVHNYPVYRQWQDELAGKGVTLIGIHSPETATERSVENLVAKIKSDDLRFPIVHDGDLANWNAWGNTMWPCVYVLDKRGQLRYFWPGELRWQGATGDKIARGWIDELLAEN